MSSSAEILVNGQHSDHLHRPRPRKPQHTQLTALSRITPSSSNDGADNHLTTEGIDAKTYPPSAVTSGRSTPVPENALPSVKTLSSARKQARAEQRRRLFPTIEFAQRVSHFDPASDYRDFHGFFNLFWIGLAIMGITTMLRNLKDTGHPMRVEIWSLFTVKLWHLAIADFLMVATTTVSMYIHSLARKSPSDSAWSWKNGGMALQSIFQVLWLAFWIAIPFLLEWTWTAQVFLLLHTMVMLMKMHSWAFYNGHLCETEKRLHRLDLPTSAEDREPAYLYPSAVDRQALHLLPSEDNAKDKSTRVAAASAGARAAPTRLASTSSADTGVTDAAGTPAEKSRAGSTASGSDDGEGKSLDELQTLREDLARELTSPMGNVTYPRNLTWSNYADFLLCPTLCYELEYPRVDSINWTNLISKIIATFGCIFLLTVTSEEFILPVLVDAQARLQPAAALSAPPGSPLAAIASPAASLVAGIASAVNPPSSSSSSSPPSWLSSSTPSSSLSASETLLILAESISWLLFPFMLTFLLVFLVIFEYVLGAFAEITHFGDRHFYSDWWNSTDWMEFSREWNIPVYSFLRRHVYSASRPHTGRAGATLITFLISAVGHEIVMACITKKIRGYGFICQMLQLPIVMLQRTRWVRGRRTLNNVCFWISMVMGLSMICALYVLV